MWYPIAWEMKTCMSYCFQVVSYRLRAETMHILIFSSALLSLQTWNPAFPVVFMWSPTDWKLRPCISYCLSCESGNYPFLVVFTWSTIALKLELFISLCFHVVLYCLRAETIHFLPLENWNHVFPCAFIWFPIAWELKPCISLCCAVVPHCLSAQTMHFRMFPVYPYLVLSSCPLLAESWNNSFSVLSYGPLSLESWSNTLPGNFTWCPIAWDLKPCISVCF